MLCVTVVCVHCVCDVVCLCDVLCVSVMCWGSMCLLCVYAFVWNVCMMCCVSVMLCVSCAVWACDVLCVCVMCCCVRDVLCLCDMSGGELWGLPSHDPGKQPLAPSVENGVLAEDRLCSKPCSWSH